MSVDPVILELKADLKQYQADLNSAQRLTDKKLSAIEARGFAMGQNIKKGFNLAQAAAIGFVAAIGVDGVVQAAQRGLEYASSLGEVAQQLGVSTDALQEYRYAATQAGLSQEEMDQALSQLTRRIGEAASGTKAQAEAFTKLGLSVKDANGNVIDAGEAIPKIADALRDVQSPAERAAILMDLFGRSGQKLEPLLSGGSAAVNELRDAAQQLGLVLSQEQIQKADDTADKLAALNTVLSARIASVVSDNADSILGMANALATLVSKAFDAANAVKAFQLRMYAFSENIIANNPLYSQQERARAAKKRDLLRYGAAKLDGTVDTKGSFRDYSINGLGVKASGGAKPSATAAAGATATNKTSRTSSAGPSASDLAQRAAQNEARYQDEIGRLRIDRLRAEAEYTGSVEQQYAAFLAALDEELKSFTRQVETDDSINEEKRKRLIAEKTAAIASERQNVEQNRARAIADRAAQLDIAELRAQADAVDAKAQLAVSSKDRLRLELEMFDLQDRLRTAELDRILATEATASAAWQAAKIERDTLNATAGDRRQLVERRNASPLGQYRQQLQDRQDSYDDVAEQLIVDEVESVRSSLRSSISDAIGTDDPLITGLIDLLVQDLVIKPLADALAGARSGGGGGGLLGSIVGGIGAIFGGGAGFGSASSINTSALASLRGRASGGRVNAGEMYRVNEAGSPGRVEGFIPQGAGHVIPLGQMNRLSSGRGGNVYNISVDSRNSVTPDGFARDLSSHILRQAAAMDGQTAQAVVRAMPGRMGQYGRDGV